MYKTLLVGIDIERGAELLRILDDQDIKVSVALWAVLAEYEDWRLILACRQFDELRIGEAYGLLHKALDAGGMPVALTPTTLILRMDDPFIKQLRRLFRKAKSVMGMRLGGQTIGDRFVEEVYVYRIS